MALEQVGARYAEFSFEQKMNDEMYKISFYLFIHLKSFR